MGPFLDGKQGIGSVNFLNAASPLLVDTHHHFASPDPSCFMCLESDQSCVYELSAVLIHRGISAYSGHYIAHVKDACTGDWYKFNDEEIEKMEGKKLQLGIEEDIGELLWRKSRCKWLASHDAHRKWP